MWKLDPQACILLSSTFRERSRESNFLVKRKPAPVSMPVFWPGTSPYLFIYFLKNPMAFLRRIGIQYLKRIHFLANYISKFSWISVFPQNIIRAKYHKMDGKKLIAKILVIFCFLLNNKTK